jgi:hypothetical protein
VRQGHGHVVNTSSAAGLVVYRQAGVDVVSVNIGDSDVPFERQVRLAASARSCGAADDLR